MKDGTILFYSNIKKPMFVAIVEAVTGCKITHVIIYSKGFYYESVIKIIKGRVYSGVMKSEKVDAPFAVGNFVRDLTEVESIKLNRYLESQIGQLYNIWLLLNMIWIYSLRLLWKKLKWCPFQNPAFGHICSGLVDRAYKNIDIDLLINELEAYTTPCDLWHSPRIIKHSTMLGWVH